MDGPHEFAFAAARTAARRALASSLPAAAIIAFVALGAAGSFAMEGRPLPAPAADEPALQGASETAVLAGGCFWGVQGVFEHVKGVTSAVSGYAGGGMAQAHYADVSTGSTGHAESVRVTFDPAKISYGRILQIFFSVAHDPTELNRQGPDEGSQYRSAIFPVSAEQAKIATTYIAQLNATHALGAPIATKIEPSRIFFPAEAYHQDFLARNPTYGYIVVNDLPKIENLKRLFPNVYRADPVLTSAER
ncbi:peptide-methionine (S)-S-oxide reductase MsrA [Methylocella silvestris]|uniref:Peptide methionine sulfoxide reductase MsrA n=1 Tax=Methylocella silvestris TaxID=199596 RepID=A0A2J7TH41_METSI|nr:peptide-methionine (S)-S-oxide reductase MsrA [Methylocella silvestris]PNG26081.1 peptide-methionine (S)-S-oxide reductase [Methylocella silvestris]